MRTSPMEGGNGEEGSQEDEGKVAEEEQEADKCAEEGKKGSGEVDVQLPEFMTFQVGCWDFGSSVHLKGCKWAPDGTCLLVSGADRKVRLFNLPTELYSGPLEQELPDMSPVLSLGLGETVYDFCWFPLMSSWDPDTACFLTSCKDLPVQLWDAFHLTKRASYLPRNHLDELVSPYSLCFSLDGQKLYCGFNKCVRVFETRRPGDHCTTIPTHEKEWGGQKGIVSCIAMLPTHSNMYAFGSYSNQVGVYSDLANGAVLLLTGVGGGVTHITFSSDGNLLFVGFRKSHELKVWDLRNPGNHLATLHRPLYTNQRIYFDLYKEHYLLSGTGEGYVYGWDIRSLGSGDLSPQLCHFAHSDPVTGCHVHPHLPLLATASGQRHFPLPLGSEDEEDVRDAAYDNSLKVWSLLPSAIDNDTTTEGAPTEGEDATTEDEL